MFFLEPILMAVFSVFLMFFLCKLIGNRSISQMNMFDYINSITIGSIAAELAVSDFSEALKPAIAMVIYAYAAILFAYASSKNVKLRRFVEGKSILLMKDGKLFDENFKKAKIDINEFLMQCRLGGFFDIREIKAAVQESNGRISILPMSYAKPVSLKDLKVPSDEACMTFNIILDGKLMVENLKESGSDVDKVYEEMKLRGVNLSEIFLGTCNSKGEFMFFVRQKKRDEHDFFDI